MIHPPSQLRLITLSEWERRLVPSLTLTEEDRRLVDAISQSDDCRLSIDELVTGLLICARSWVGVVRFSSFKIQIVPKLAGGHLGLVELIDFTSGLNCLVRHPAVRSFESAGSSLLDLIALLFVESCEALVRGGLLADYREVEDELPVLRGRLRVREQVLERFGRIDRLACRYDEQITNIQENQLLLAALTVCSRFVRHPALSLRVRRMLNLLAEACSLDEVDLRAMRSELVYNRLNEPYREPHSLAWLLLDAMGIDDLFNMGSRRCFAFLLDMNRLFEDFVGRWLTRLLHGNSYRVLIQRRDRTILWNADLGKPYTQVIPDIVVQAGDGQSRFLPIDAKYKLYDDKKLASSDIYQTFLYAFAYGSKVGSVLPTSLLLYPASEKAGSTLRLHVRSSGVAGGELVALGIHIPTALAEARSGQPGEMGLRVQRRIQAVLEQAAEAHSQTAMT